MCTKPRGSRLWERSGFLRRPRTCSTLLCSCTCPVSAAPWNNLLSRQLSLSIQLPRLPVSARGLLETLLTVFLVHFLSIPPLRAVSPHIYFPEDAWTLLA